MRSLSFLAMLYATAAALPALQPGKLTGDAKTDSSVDPDLDPAFLTGTISTLFEATCHNICMKMFPKPGKGRDKCMSICHHNHDDSSHGGMEDGM
ncbi:uncharacterized protein JN550_012869 [Neoarthrinium moseri]|uniref:uncharacterized protein n=1 Tax=Neoarthrinium moseri TaxID=1658444 RepID=UPI001FDAFB37|nr:uncharacterized protein JN550_012869 [Neoarthrinium moseri]KAI1858047.1 hypothetical protein JN550_012869 [Neoarthrinium moseri]